MGRRRRIVTQEDGTPVEVDATPEEIAADEAAQAAADAELAEFVPPTPKPVAGRVVIWTQAAQDAGAFSEHGRHKAGEEVTTDHADILIANGFATEKD